MIDWFPNPEDVGDVLRSRTRDRHGNEVGFTDATRPTAAQVSNLAETAVAEIAAQAGAVPESLQSFARRIAALSTACLVELTYFPEEVATRQSPYPELKDKFDELLRSLLKQVESINAGNEPGHSSLPLAQFTFPDREIIGFSRRF